MKAVFSGKTKRARFIPDDPDGFRLVFDVPDDTELDVSIEDKKRKRTGQQNRWYFGKVLPMIGKEIGIYDKEEVHNLMKSMFNYELAHIRGEEMKILKSTASLSTIEFSEFCEAVRHWASSFLGLNIPDPISAGY